MTNREIPDPPGKAPDGFMSLSEAERLDIALRSTPRGAMMLALLSVGILMLLWLAIYFFVFIPRGDVG